MLVLITCRIHAINSFLSKIHYNVLANNNFAALEFHPEIPYLHDRRPEDIYRIHELRPNVKT